MRTIGQATLADGGGTFSARTLRPVSPESGYAVGMVRGTARIVRSPSWATLSERADAIAVGVLAVVREFPHAEYIGTWVNDDAVHIDPVAIIADLGDAIALGRASGQDAIYSFSDGRTISLDGAA